MAVEALHEAPEFQGRPRVVDGGQRGAEHAALDAAVAQRDALPAGGDPVSVREAHLLDQPRRRRRRRL